TPPARRRRGRPGRALRGALTLAGPRPVRHEPLRSPPRRGAGAERSDGEATARPRRIGRFAEKERLTSLALFFAAMTIYDECRLPSNFKCLLGKAGQMGPRYPENRADAVSRF